MNDKIIELYGLKELGGGYHMGQSLKNGGKIYAYKDTITFSNCDIHGNIIDKDKTFIIGVFENRWQSATVPDQALINLPKDNRHEFILFMLRQIKSSSSTVPAP